MNKFCRYATLMFFTLAILGTQIYSPTTFKSATNQAAASTQTVATSLGREFFVTFDANLVNHDTVLPKLWLFISGDPGTSVDLHYPPYDPNTNSGTSIETISIGDTGVYSKDVTSTLLTSSTGWNITKSFVNGIITGNLTDAATRISSHAESKKFNAIKLISSSNVSVYGVNIHSVTSDAFIAVPTASLGNTYRAVSYFHHGRGSTERPSRLSIIATETGTTSVTITAPSGVNLNFSASGSISTGSASIRTVSLQKGEVYSVSGYVSPSTTLGSANQLATRDITGTLIEADKKIVVTSSNECAQVGSEGSCDHLVEYLQPVTSWGKEFLLPGSIGARNADVYRVVAHEDGTQIFLNNAGSALATLNAGEFHEFSASGLGAVDLLTSNKPVQVAKFLSGQDGFYFGTTNFSDPSMTMITPTLQFLREFKVATPAQNFDALNTLTVIYKTSDEANLAISGKDTSGITETRSASRLGTNGVKAAVAGTDYSFARIDIPRGTYSVSSSSGIGVYVEGFNRYNSYSYPGGFAVVNLIENPAGAIALEDQIQAQNNPPQNSGGGSAPSVTPTPTVTPTQTPRVRRTVTPTPTPVQTTATPTPQATPEQTLPQPSVGSRTNPAQLVRRPIEQLQEILTPVVINLNQEIQVPVNQVPDPIRQSFEQIPFEQDQKIITSLPSAVINDGVTEDSRIVVINETKSQVLTGDGGLLTLEARADQEPVPVDSQGRIQMVQNNVVISEGKGLAPNTEFSVFLFSDPILLGVGLTNQLGEFYAALPVEGSIPVGEHTLQVVGIAPGGKKRTVSLPVIVVEDKEIAQKQSINNVIEVAETPVQTLLNSISYLAILALLIFVLIVWAFWFLLKRRKDEEEEESKKQ